MSNNPIIFVHGFKYDNRTFGPDHPEYHTYPRWREMLPDREVIPFKWFSNPSLTDAWKKGYWNHYRYAWALAKCAGDRLVGVAMAPRGPVDIVCHSLGSRVVMTALSQRSTIPHALMNISKVLVLNGAEYSHTGRAVALACPGIKFYNIIVPEDDVLNDLARFAPGQHHRFLGTHGGGEDLPNWQDLHIDDDESPTHAWAEARELPAPAGDNPCRRSDHWYSFENEDNWPLYRAVFSGEYDEWQLGVT